MPKMTMEEFLNQITVANSPLGPRNSANKEIIAQQIKEAMEEKLPLLKDPANLKNVMDNLWTVSYRGAAKDLAPLGDLGEDPYKALADLVAQGRQIVLPMNWMEGAKGVVPDAALYRARPDQMDMVAIGGGAYQGKFYLQAMDYQDLQRTKDLECPLKEPGFWDKFVDFVKSIFHSRGQVCAQWEDYYSNGFEYDDHMMTLRDNNAITHRKLYEIEGRSPFDVELINWDLDGADLDNQISNQARTSDFEFIYSHFNEPTQVYKALLANVQHAACRDLYAKDSTVSIAYSNPQAVKNLMNDLKAYVFEKVNREDVENFVKEINLEKDDSSAVLDEKQMLGKKLDAFGEKIYNEYKKDLAKAVEEHQDTLPVKGLLKHEKAEEIQQLPNMQ